MSRLNFFSLSALAILGLALLPGSAVSQQKLLKDQLAGSWILPIGGFGRSHPN
jgi:hypothetical protein